MGSDQKVHLIIRLRFLCMSAKPVSVFCNWWDAGRLRRWDDAPAVLFKWVHSQKLNVLPCYHPLLWTRTPGLKPSSCLLGLYVESHLSFSLLMDPVSELDHLCVDARTVLPRTALAPAHNTRQEPPSAALQTHQRTSWITLRAQTCTVIYIKKEKGYAYS